MSTDYLKIAGGTVYDPANGVDGQVRDLWIAGGKIVAPPADPEIRPSRVIDARGLVVMPGGVDMHCHIVGPKVNTARMMCPEQSRQGEPIRRTRLHAQRHDGESCPARSPPGTSTPASATRRPSTPRSPPLAARHAHDEFADTPCIDKGFLRR